MVFLSCSLQNTECMNKPNLLQREVGMFSRNIRMSFLATLAGDFQCNVFDVLVKCDKTFFVESHEKSKQHQEKLENPKSKQTFLQLYQANFKEQVVFSFLTADISLHKLNHPFLKSLFLTIGKALLGERTVL